MLNVQKIIPNLWFSSDAENAVKFYTSVFTDSKILSITRYSKEGYEVHQMPEGTVMTIEFQIEGQRFVALNGGPVFQFNEAISFIINCDTQQEIDYYWDKLSEGGDVKAQQCGWLKDKFGVSWQVVPAILPSMLLDGDRNKADRVMHKLLQMKKINMDELKQAYSLKLENAV